MPTSKVYHRDKHGNEREINNNAVDYGDGTVMVQYLDNDQVAIVPKEEIINRPQGTTVADDPEED
jgi:hypothetical protein